MNKYVGIIYVYVYFFLIYVFCVIFICLRYFWFDLIFILYCNICFINGVNILRFKLFLLFKSFRYFMAVWRILGYGFVKVNNRFIMIIKYYYVYKYVN